MMKKMLTLLLAAALLLPCLLSGCSLFGTPQETTTTSGNDDPGVPEGKTMKLTTVNVTAAGDSMNEDYAVAELSSYLAQKGVLLAEDGFPISIIIDSSVGEDGYKIEATLEGTLGMTIRGGNGRGILNGVYRFLQEYASVRFFTPTLERCEEGDVIIKEGVLMEYTPVMKARRVNWASIAGNADWCAKNAINNCWVSLDGAYGGTRLEYGDYFVHTLGPLTETTYPYPIYQTNPCLTDPEILALVIKNVRKALDENPDINIISVSQNDYEEYCHCPNCQKIDEEEGSPSGTMLRFVNAVAENIEEDYPGVLVDTLAYKYTQSAPKITKPRHNVVVRLCSIKCCFTHPLNDENCEVNKQFHDDLIEWGKICDNIHVWDYTTDFHYYISTFANFDVIRENMKFYAENNVVSMFPQGNGQGVSGEFGELRAYLLAQLMWNPYMSEEEYYTHMDDFLKAYYGDGWSYIREYIDLTTKLAANGGYEINKTDESAGEAVCGQGIYDHPFTAITREEYHNYSYRFDELWALAEEMAGSRREYVKRSAMQWRLAKLYLYPNAEDAKALIADAKAAGVPWKEGNAYVNKSSDLSLSPFFWSYTSNSSQAY